MSKIEEALELALEKDIDENFLKEEITPIFRPKLWIGLAYVIQLDFTIIKILT